MSAPRCVLRALPVVIILAAAFVRPANAQERREPEGTPLPDYARRQILPPEGQAVVLARNALPNIMLVGYWPPSNEMIRRFSSSPTQNPAGWVGEDWEGRGYNVYAFFPEFPSGLGQGVGDFEVDYQDTSADFWSITDQVRPIGLITFGRASENWDWEVEDRHRNRSVWSPDYAEPWYPTPNPPDNTVINGAKRYSTLPKQAIVDAVNGASLGLNSFIDYLYGGDFLCEYIGYHACWYHDLHANRDDPNNPTWNVAAGHIHTGYAMPVATVVQATEITLRELTTYLDAQTLEPGDMDCDGSVGFTDINPFILALLNPDVYHAQFPKCVWRNGDCDGDGTVGFSDINGFVDLVIGN
jgi:hypothetical protein